VVGQLVVTPSQVTEPVPTVQLMVPEQVFVWEDAEQKSSQGRGEQMKSSEQALLQFTDAVHPSAAAGAGRTAASTRASTNSGRTDETILFMASP
jgi:hypothetical protein